MEAEARQIITDAVVVRSDRTAPAELQSFVDGLYGDSKPEGVVDELIAERRRQARNE